MPPVLMEGAYYAPPQTAGSRPSMGFPVGTALVLIIIFSLSALFSGCYHWDKLRSLHRSYFSAAAIDLEASLDGGGGDYGPRKPIPLIQNSKETHRQTLPVIMPGDEVPKFLALPCPCQPPRSTAGKMVAPPPLTPPKLLHGVEAVSFLGV